MKVELLSVIPDAEKLIEEKQEVISTIRSLKNLMVNKRNLILLG